MHYNFVRVHETIKTTPAVKAGLAEQPWTLEKLVRAALAEMGVKAEAPPPKRPEHYHRKTHKDVVAGLTATLAREKGKDGVEPAR